MNNNNCIIDNNDDNFYYPFIGINVSNYANLKKYYRKKTNKDTSDITLDHQKDKDKLDHFISPIQPKDYLEQYYNIESLEDAYTYLLQRTDLNILTKYRIFDYICFCYIKNSNLFIKSLNNLLDIVKLLLNIETNIHDDIIINLLKKIKKEYFKDEDITHIATKDKKRFLEYININLNLN